jgi:acyl-coenzyme A synthetase/AMP-(fatty) acid ligase
LQGKLDRLAAALVLTEEGRLACAEMGVFRFSRLLRKNLLATHEAAAVPRQWRFVDALPHKEMGKRSDADIRALFGVAA